MQYPDNFIKNYLSYIEPLTDSPTDFKFMSALMVLSMVIGNKVYIQFGGQRIYPNLWLILIAPSSLYRKSTILHNARSLVEKVNPEAILPNEITPEALLETLQDRPIGCFIWSEFAGALAGWERSYMQGTKEFLSDIFDCPSFYQRKLKNAEYTIKNPCIGIFTATALSWFLSKVKDGDLRGGFLARFCYILTGPKSQFIAIPPAPDTQKANQLVKYLNSLRDINCRMDTSVIHKDYENWLREHEDELGKNQEHELLSGFYSRLAIYCLKFSMLYQLSENPNPVISKDSLRHSIALVEGLKKNVKKLVCEDLILDPRERDKQRILGLVRKNGGISHSECLQLSHMDRNNFKKMIDTLIEQESIKREMVNRPGSQKKTQWYYIRNN